jgi:nitrogen fixation-related uncharacterized protein
MFAANALITVVIIVASLIFVSAVYALYWASRHGQLERFEEGAKSIFTEEEPEGQPLDSFPDKEKPQPPWPPEEETRS